MKILIPLLAIIVAVSANVPQDSDYDTEHLKIVKACEDHHEVDDAEKAVWWAWKIPANPKRCYLACVMAHFKWLTKDGDISVSAIKESYEAVGHGSSAPDQEFLNENCENLNSTEDHCSKTLLLYTCLLEKSPNVQHFKDAFDGKPNTV
ncbi:uncharacterized protein LOC134827229 [Culicoides brevitarsis]|uniref:uncharacterized protein LOC134827229 n=1 Tax=Culicoides brevitarsis TaxID=469753 RepID=UPI00307B27C1